MTSRNWVFTDFLSSDGDNWTLLDLEPTPENKIRYSIYQIEMCPKTSRSHFQGYIQFREPVRMQHVKDAIGSDKVHLQRQSAFATADQARDYCCKKDTAIEGPFETGTFASQGQRTDWALALTQVKERKNIREILEQQPHLIPNISALQKCDLLFQEQRNWPTEVLILVGDTGVGKTRWVAENYPGYYPKQRSNWWDGYTNQETVLIDDFYGWLPFDEVLRLCDRYPMLVQTKGSQVNFVAKRIIFTSNVTPDKWWKNEKIKAGLEPLHRRTTKWIHFYPDGHSEYTNWATFWFKLNGSADN